MSNNNLESSEIPRTKGKFKAYLEVSDIENDEYVIKWLKGIKSKKQRLSLMKRMCNFVEKTPSQLAQEHQKDLKKDTLERSNIAKLQLNAFFGYLTSTNDKSWKNTLFPNKKIDNKVNWNSARQYVFSKLLSFYSRLGIDVKYNKKDKPPEHKTNVREKTWRENGNFIEKTDKKTVLKNVRDFLIIRDKAILLSKFSSALDDVDLFNLTIQDYQRGKIPKFNICYLQGIRQKDGMLYQTFLGSEALELIELYLLDRKDKNNGSEIPQNHYLFAVKEEKMDARYFAENFKKVVQKLGYTNITPKGIRRFFSSYLESNSINKGIIKRMMGQKGDIRDEHYNDLFNNALEGEYMELAKYFVENIDALVSLGNGNKKVGAIDKRVNELENLNKNIVTELDNTNKKIDNLTDIIKGLGVFIQEDFERLNEDITADYKDKIDSEYFKSRHKLLDNLNKRIEKLGLKE